MNAGRTTALLVPLALAACGPAPVPSETPDTVVHDASTPPDTVVVIPAPVCRATTSDAHTPGPPNVELRASFYPDARTHDLVATVSDTHGRSIVCSGALGLMVVPFDSAGSTFGTPTRVTLQHGASEYPRCQHAVVDGDTAYVSARVDSLQPVSFVSVVDLAAQPPVERSAFTHDGWSVEGLANAGGHLFLALQHNGLAVVDATSSGFTVRSQLATLGDARAVAVHDGVAWVALGAAGLAAVDVHDVGAPRMLAQLTLGGSAQGLVLDASATTAYVALGDAGVAVVDLHDPSAPALVTRIVTPDPVLGVDVRDGTLAVAAWSDARVYDVRTPSRPLSLGAVHPPTMSSVSRVTGVALGDHTLSVVEWLGLHRYTLTADALAPSLDVHAPEIIVPGTAGTSAAMQSIDVQNAGRTTLHVSSLEAPAGFRVSWSSCDIEPGATASLDVERTTFGADLPADASLTIHSDDPVTPAYHLPVRTDRAAIVVGAMAPDVTLEPTDGSATRSLSSLRGSVVVLAYFASFCPACGLEFPDLETSVWRTYRDRGVVVLGLNPQTFEPRDTPDQIAQFVAQTGITFPVGWDAMETYAQFRDPAGPRLSPFPLDVVVDRSGHVARIATEYSPDALRTTIDSLLAQ